MQPKPLTWSAPDRGGMYRSQDGKYLIVPQTLTNGAQVYQLRYRAVPTSLRDPGALLGESVNAAAAEAAAERHQYAAHNADGRSVPENYPAAALARFFWPISEGVTRGALTVDTRPDGSVIARVVGMARGVANADGEATFAPVDYASVVLPPNRSHDHPDSGGGTDPLPLLPDRTSGTLIDKVFDQDLPGDPNDLLDTATVDTRLAAALQTIVRFGGVDGDHHKAWVLDQVTRMLAGADYEQLVARACSGEDGPNTHEWDTGIAP